MEASDKYISLGPADYRKGVYGGVFHQGGPPAGSGNGTRSETSFRERGHRICTSLQQGNQALQPVFHISKEGWRDASHFRSSSSERLRHAAKVQNVNFETNRATDQIRGLVCHDRSQGRILPHIHPSISKEVPEVRSWGQSIPISGSSILPRIINLHFHEMRRCPRGATPFHIIKVTRRCLRVLIMWKKPWFLSQGPMLGASCRRKMLTTDFPRSLCSRESWREFAGTGFYYFSLPAMAVQSMVPRYNIPSRRAASGAPCQEGTSVPSGGLEISPPTRTMETVGLASEGAQLIDPDLSTKVIETILHSRAPSMRKLYALKWRVFTS